MCCKLKYIVYVIVIILYIIQGNIMYMLLCVSIDTTVNNDNKVYLFIDLGMNVSKEDVKGRIVLRRRDSNVMRDMFLIRKIKEMLFVNG